jgi:hypothetical protein
MCFVESSSHHPHACSGRNAQRCPCQHIASLQCSLYSNRWGPYRCIKPNPESQPGNLTPNYVLEQLRAGGVLEAVRIACAGYPTRKAFRPFAIRYNILLASGRGAYRHLNPETLQEEEAADISRKVLQAVKVMGWQMGKTRVFLRAGQLAQLEVRRLHSVTLPCLSAGSLCYSVCWRAGKFVLQLDLSWAVSELL